MAESSIPVDLFNPGQVFACMGFLEAADALCGNAEGGFDWSKSYDVQFRLRADGGSSPIGETLEFLATADVESLAPTEWDEEPRKGENPVPTETFPGPKGDKTALPIRLQDSDGKPIDIDHWTDGSSRNPFKLYAGNRSAYSIAHDMLRGKSGRDATLGIAHLLKNRREDLTLSPFDECIPMGGSFNFDPRGAWTAIDVGYSPDAQNQKVMSSPVVEILAAWGLQHARPTYETRLVRYGAWGAVVPPLLARPALAGVDVAIPIRKFEFTLDSKYNKVVTYAKEEVA